MLGEEREREERDSERESERDSERNSESDHKSSPLTLPCPPNLLSRVRGFMDTHIRIFGWGWTIRPSGKQNAPFIICCISEETLRGLKGIHFHKVYMDFR